MIEKENLLCESLLMYIFQKYMAEARSKIVHQPKFSDLASGGMAQTNWKFVETLLKECKTKVMYNCI